MFSKRFKKLTSIEIFNQEFSNEKDKSRKEFICRKLLETDLFKDLNKKNEELLIATISEYEQSRNPDELIIWIKIMNEILKYHPNLMSTYQEIMITTLCSPSFTDNSLKFITLNFITDQGQKIYLNSNDIPQSIIHFLVFDNLLLLNENTTAEILTLLYNFILKKGGLNIEGFLMNFIINIICLIAFKFNLNYFSSKEDKLQLKTIELCLDILVSFVVEHQINKKRIISLVCFLIVFFNVNCEEKGFDSNIHFIAQNPKAFQRELIDLLHHKYLDYHFQSIEQIHQKDSVLFQFIFNFNGDLIKKNSNIYMDFNTKLNVGNIYSKETIKKEIKVSSIKIIGKLFLNEKLIGFDMPHNIILSNFVHLLENDDYFHALNETISGYINLYKYKIFLEWDALFDIIDNMITLLKSVTVEMKKNTIYRKSLTSPLTLPSLSSIAAAMSLNINQSIEIPNITKRNSIEQLLLKIIDLIHRRKFNGKIQRVKKALFNLGIISDEYLYLWKIKLILEDSDSFRAHIVDIIKNDLLNQKSHLIMINILQGIKKYYYTYHHKEHEAIEIEGIIKEHNLMIITSLELNQRMLLKYSALIVFIVYLTKNNNFFRLMIDDFLFNLSDSILNYEKMTLLSIIDKLICSFQKDKLNIVMEKLIEKVLFLQVKNDRLEENRSIVSKIIYVIKYLYINQYNEIEARQYHHRRKMPSFFLSNYQEVEDAQKNFGKDRKLIYASVDLGKFYHFFLYIITHTQHNTAILSEVFSLINKHLRQLFFFRHLDLCELLKLLSMQIISQETFDEYTHRDNIINHIVQFYININYHLNTSLLDLIPIEEKKDKEGFNELLHITDPHYKMKQDIIEMIISRVDYMINITMNHKYMPSFTQQKPIKDETSIPAIPLMIPIEEPFPLVNMCDFIRQYLSILEYYLFSLSDFNQKPKTENTFYSRKNRNGCLQITKDHIYGSTDLTNLVLNFLKLLRKCKALAQYDNNFAFIIIKVLYMSKDLIFSFDNEPIIIEIICLLLCISWPKYEREIINQFKETYKYLFLNDYPIEKRDTIENKKDKIKRILLIEWFGDIVTMFYIERVKAGNQLLHIIQKVFNKLSDIRQNIFIELCKWNLTSKTNRDNLKKCLKFNKQENIIEAFYDNLHIITLSKVTDDNTNNTSCKMTIRNIISNVSMIMKAAPSIWNEEKNPQKKIESIINRNIIHKRTHLIPLNMSNNSLIQSNPELVVVAVNPSNNISYSKEYAIKVNEKKYSYHFQTIYRQLSKQNYFDKPNISASITSLLETIDLSSVYTVMSCGIIFYPNISQITNDQLILYTGNVSHSYITFINSLGNTFEINESTSNISLIGQDHTGKEGKYSIYHQDAIFQVIYHCANLIIPDKIDTLKHTRQKILGNDYISIIWMDNSYIKFNPSIIKSQKTFIYIVIYPYSISHYYIKLKFPKLKEETSQLTKEKDEIIQMIKKTIIMKNIIHIDKECKALSNYINKIVIIASLLSTIYLEKMYNDNNQDAIVSKNVFYLRDEIFKKHMHKNSLC